MRILLKIVNKGEWFRQERSNVSESDLDGLRKAPLPNIRWKGSLKRDRKKPRTVKMRNTEVRIAAALMVPQTPMGALAKLLREKMDSMAPSLGWKYRIVEKAGTPIIGKVSKSNPWILDMCRDSMCAPLLDGR